MSFNTDVFSGVIGGGPDRGFRARDAANITKSDSTILNCDAVFVGGAGNIAVITQAGTTLTITGVAASTLLPIACQKVMSTNTTATNMVALYY